MADNRVLDYAQPTLRAISETVWTDDTGAYFVRVNIGGDISWTDMSGAEVEAPGAGARPASASVPDPA